MQHPLGEGAVELVEIDLRVAAFPRVENLQVAPVVLRQHGAVLGFERTQLVGARGVGLKIGLNIIAYPLRDVERRIERTMLNIIAIVVVELVDVVLHLHDGGRVSRNDKGYIALDTHTHEGVVARRVVLNRED